MTIIFQNPGLIDLAAVRTMGVSVKKPGSFGFFGTGLKFAIATVLRGGGSITIWRGVERHEITLVEQRIRGEMFWIVCLDGVSMGFTDQLGRNWEPWMALRELGCNAMDEGGRFGPIVGDPEPALRQTKTSIVVDWPEMEQVSRSDIFCEDRQQLWLLSDRVQCLSGEATHVFYRGVRALKVQMSSVVTWNILSLQTLTEDRSLGNFWLVQQEICRTILAMDDSALLRTILTAGQSHFEHSLPLLSHVDQQPPSREFLDVVIEARRSRDRRLSPSALEVLERHLRRASVKERFSYRDREASDDFTLAMDALGEIFCDDQLDLDSLQFVTVDTLPDSALIVHENDHYYLSSDFFRKSRREMAEIVLRCVLENRYDVVDVVLPALPASHSATRSTAHDRIVLPDETETGDDVEATVRPTSLLTSPSLVPHARVMP